MSSPLSITLYLLHTDSDGNGSSLETFYTARARDEALLGTFVDKGTARYTRGLKLLDKQEDDDAWHGLNDLIREVADSCDSWTREDVRVDAAPLVHSLIATVERAHFRTTEDTGANPCAMTVMNALRRAAGLPYISRDDLPAWDGKAYVQPAGSKLLAKHAPVPLSFS
jgi:hypothetical protein